MVECLVVSCVKRILHLSSNARRTSADIDREVASRGSDRVSARQRTNTSHGYSCSITSQVASYITATLLVCEALSFSYRRRILHKYNGALRYCHRHIVCSSIKIPGHNGVCETASYMQAGQKVAARGQVYISGHITSRSCVQVALLDHSAFYYVVLREKA